MTPAIDHILASLGASHTGRYTPDQLDYYELADVFRFAYRDRLRRLFPPDGEITYRRHRHRDRGDRRQALRHRRL